MTEFKWINTDRVGACAMCSTQLQPGERVLWSLVDKSKVWCRPCGTKFHNDDITPQNGREGQSSQQRAGASTGNGTSVGATNASTTPLTTTTNARARWELVTADDGVIVLRRADR